MATMEEMMAQIEALKAQNAALQAQGKSADGLLPMKVSEKGAVSIYGINSRFPVTLYGASLAKVFSPAMVEKANRFALDNIAKLSFVKLVKDGGKDDKGNDTYRPSTPEEIAKGEALRAQVRATLEANLSK